MLSVDQHMSRMFTMMQYEIEWHFFQNLMLFIEMDKFTSNASFQSQNIETKTVFFNHQNVQEVKDGEIFCNHQDINFDPGICKVLNMNMFIESKNHIINEQNIQNKCKNVLIVDMKPSINYKPNHCFLHNKYFCCANFDNDELKMDLNKFIDSRKKLEKSFFANIHREANDDMSSSKNSELIIPEIKQKIIEIDEQKQVLYNINAIKSENSSFSGESVEKDNFSVNSPTEESSEEKLNEYGEAINIMPSASSASDMLTESLKGYPKKGLPKRQNFTDQQRKILNAYLQIHSHNPYACPTDIDHLKSKTGLSAKQIRTYFTNKRMRDPNLMNFSTTKKKITKM